MFETLKKYWLLSLSNKLNKCQRKRRRPRLLALVNRLQSRSMPDPGPTRIRPSVIQRALKITCKR